MSDETEATEEIKLRENIGPACPACGLPCTQYGKVHGPMAYYRCAGTKVPGSGKELHGCGMTFKRRVWKPAEMLEAIETGNTEGLKDSLQQQVDDREKAKSTVAARGRKSS